MGAAGRVAYPQVDRLLVAADAGGSNGHRDRLWKTELAQLAAEMGLSRLGEAGPGALGTGFSSQRRAGSFVGFPSGNSSALFASRCYLLPLAAT